MIIVLNDYNVHSCYDKHLALGSYKLKDLAPLSFAIQIVANFCALVFVCLMQSLSYILWMENVQSFFMKSESGFYM